MGKFAQRNPWARKEIKKVVIVNFRVIMVRRELNEKGEWILSYGIKQWSDKDKTPER